MKSIHKSAGKSIAAAIGRSANYIENPDKTEDGKLVLCYGCDMETAQAEFVFAKQLYAQQTGRNQGKHDVLAYHIRQSFRPNEVTAEKALEMGRQLAMRFTKGKHQFIVAAHTNTNNPHTHIIFNAVNMDCNRKFKDFKHSAIALRRLSDFICIENGVSIIEQPGLSQGHNRAEYLGGEKAVSIRDKVRDLIDEALLVGAPWDDFIGELKGRSCEVKEGKHIAIKIPEGKRFIRLDSLGDDYSEVALKERLSGTRIAKPRVAEVAKPKAVKKLAEMPKEQVTNAKNTRPNLPPLPNKQERILKQQEERAAKAAAQQSAPPAPVIAPKTMPVSPPVPPPKKPSLLIDIEAKLQLCHSPGFEHYAKIYNLKEAAKTLIYLQEQGVSNYEDLAEKCVAAKKTFNDNADRRQAIEKRLPEINALQMSIGKYNKNSAIFKAYIDGGKQKEFYQKHKESITSCREARAHFKELGLKNLPTIKALQTEFATLTAEKKRLWDGYPKDKENMLGLLAAKQNVERFLGQAVEKQKTKSKGDMDL